MALKVKGMLAAANDAVSTIDMPEALNLMQSGRSLVVDVRDATEVQASGKVKGALHVSRGLLEFKADPESPTYEAALKKDKVILVYCASGGRAALSGKTLKDMGYADVRNLGSFKAWVDAGGEIEKS